jgi:large subunit ribosomal protein L9
MPMQLILTQDVEDLGKAGDLVTVKSGFGRNYLLPRRLAVSATARNKSELDHAKQVIATQVARQASEAGELANRLKAMTLQFERLVGEDDKLFGSVTSRDITEQLKVAGIDLDHRKLKMDEPIKALGKYEIEVKLHGDVTATLKFWVVGKDGEAAPE